MMMNVTRSAVATICVLALFGVGTATSAEAPNADADALQLLKTMTEYISGLESFSLHTENSYEDVLDSGQKIQYNFASSVVISRPDGLRAERTDGDVTQTLVYDGETLKMYEGSHDIYAVVAAPDNLDDLLHFSRDALDLVPPAGDLVFSNSYELLTGALTSGVVVGKAVIGGMLCTQLAFTSPVVDWQIWIADGDKPLPVKYVLTTMDDPAHPQYTALISNWNTDPMIPAGFFELRVPPTATVTEFVFVDAAFEPVE
jgi:hypothetical protein